MLLATVFKFCIRISQINLNVLKIPYNKRILSTKLPNHGQVPRNCLFLGWPTLMANLNLQMVANSFVGSFSETGNLYPKFWGMHLSIYGPLLIGDFESEFLPTQVKRNMDRTWENSNLCENGEHEVRNLYHKQLINTPKSKGLGHVNLVTPLVIDWSCFHENMGHKVQILPRYPVHPCPATYPM